MEKQNRNKIKNELRINNKLLLASLTALNGKYITDKIINDNIKFLTQLYIENIEGVLLFNDYEATYSNDIDIIELIYCMNSYFGEQFKLIEKYDGVIDKISGDAFTVFWKEREDFDSYKFLSLIKELNDNIIELNKFYKKKYTDKFFIKKIILYMDYGKFLLTKTGSITRFNYTGIGEVIGRGMNLMTRLHNEKNNIFFGEDYVEKFKCNYQPNREFEYTGRRYKIYTINMPDISNIAKNDMFPL